MLAILAAHLGDNNREMVAYQDFEFPVIDGLPEGDSTLTQREIAGALARIQGQDVKR